MDNLKKFFVLVVFCIFCTACNSNNEPSVGSGSNDDLKTADNSKPVTTVENYEENGSNNNLKTVTNSKPVAIIENYEEISGNISIKRTNGTPNGSEALLYPNDEITGNVDAVKIKCAPYAEAKLQNELYIISYNPPSDIGAIADNIINYASTFWSNVENVNTAASRGSDDKLNLNPKPGFNVTLLHNHTVTFAWDGTAKNFYINNEKGEIIFETTVEGKNFIEVIPSQINLNVGQKYSWEIDENFNTYKFEILDSQTEKEILAKLEEIDSENISDDEHTLKKAAYVQLISDIYSDKIDLYWLSSQWLTQIAPSNDKLKETKSVLLRKCADHLDSEM